MHYDSWQLCNNVTFMVEQKTGYAVTLNGLVDTQGARKLAFRPIDTPARMESFPVTEKYQTFSPAASLFLREMRKSRLESYANG